MTALTLRLACIQICSGPDAPRNTQRAVALIEEAAAKGARLVALPEAVDLLEGDYARVRAYARPLAGHAAMAAFQATAKKHRLWLLVGSVAVLDEAERLVNRSYLVGPDGAVVCHYDKLHLFDVNLEPTDRKESDLYQRGDTAVVATTPWGGLGLSICYDLRFPYLFRALAHAGARVLAVPAAFMQVTGQAHWHVLLRARAIENGCFVVAPAQCGNNYGTRRSYAHSLIVDPWGRVLADGGESEGVVYGELDLAEVDRVRTTIPSLTHDRSFAVTPLPPLPTLPARP